MEDKPNKRRIVPRWLRFLLPVALVVVWLGAAVAGSGYFDKMHEVIDSDLASFLPSTAESTKLNGELEKFRDGNTLPAIVVFKKESGELAETDIAKINELSGSFKNLDGVSGDIPAAIISEDKQAAISIVRFKEGAELASAVKDIKTEVDEANLGLEYKVAGPASFLNDLNKAFAGIDGTLLMVALAVVFVILLVVYRSPLLPFLVLIVSSIALTLALAVVWHLADAGIVKLDEQVQGILFILVIGAATDYSLLYIARYREELTHYESTLTAARVALRNSFEPILAAGGTVIVGLMCLLLSDLGSNKALGPVGGAGIVMSILAALTFLPSLLLLFGRAVFWPRRPKYAGRIGSYDPQANHPAWAKVGRLVGRHPRRIWAGLTVLLLAACLGVFQLKADGVAQSDIILGTSEARDGQELLDKHFPGGSGSPAYVLVEEGQMTEAVKKLEADRGIDSVLVTATNSSSGTLPVGKAEETIKQAVLKKVEEDRAKGLETLRAQIKAEMPGTSPAMIEQAFAVASAQMPRAEQIAAEAYPFKNASPKVVEGKALLQATLTDAADSLAARDTIERIRQTLKESVPNTLVGGTSAVQHDTNVASTRDLMVIIPVILLAITIILMLLLRSVVAPLVLLATTVVSFGATLGISALLFNHVLGFSGADPSVVIFGFVFLVALGIDYNIFLMTRVREETIKHGVREGTLRGLIVTGGVITSAGIVLAATFAALGVLPIQFLVQLAFVVAFGVILDTLIVRSLLVPALTLEIGKRMWWPSSISK